MRYFENERVFTAKHKEGYMDDQDQKYIKEISRVKKLKRAVEAEVELLRTQMESGIIRLRVSSDRSFRKAIAEIAIKGSSGYYADPVKGRVYFWEYATNNCVNKPWAESVAFRIIPIRELFPDDTDFINADIGFVLSQIVDEVSVNLID